MTCNEAHEWSSHLLVYPVLACPCSVEKINMRCYGPKPDWFMQMVPSGLLPVIEVSPSK